MGLADGSGVLEVRDHGPGIDPEHAARVFERFYRVDASRGRDSGGAGLGMAIVAAIVDAHHGSVALEPTPGGGTTVRITLPVPPTGVGPISCAQATTRTSSTRSVGQMTRRRPGHPSGTGPAAVPRSEGYHDGFLPSA